jgi:integrase
MAKVLTAPAVLRLRAVAGKQREIPDAGARGLYLVIGPTGTKSWALRYRRPVSGRSAKLVLGRVALVQGPGAEPEPVLGATLSLAGARRLAAALSHDISQGRDPATARQERSGGEAVTFAVAAKEYVSHIKRAGLRGWPQMAIMLGLDAEDLLPVKGGLASRWRESLVAEISEQDAFRVIDEARMRGVPGTNARNKEPSEPRARSMYSALSTMFGWLRERRVVASSPLTNLTRPDPPAARERVLGDDEIKKFWRATAELPEPFASALRLMLLTGQRREEVAGMRRSELSADLATWSLPGARTKNKRPHVVPMPPVAREIIAARLDAGKQLHDMLDPNGDQLVFTTTGTTPISGWSKMKRILDSLMTGVPPWVIHDLRRTAVTGMAEMGIAPHVVELIVNHVSGHKAGIAGIYNRSEQMPARRAALERWADHVVGEPSVKVVALKKRGRGRR